MKNKNTFNIALKGLKEASTRVSGYSVEKRAELHRSIMKDRKKNL